MDNWSQAVLFASLIHHSLKFLPAPSSYQLARKQKQEIWIEQIWMILSYEKAEDKLHQSVKTLNEEFLLLSTEQIIYLSYRLHAILQPKPSPETQLIEWWTIQSQRLVERSMWMRTRSRSSVTIVATLFDKYVKWTQSYWGIRVSLIKHFRRFVLNKYKYNACAKSVAINAKVKTGAMNALTIWSCDEAGAIDAFNNSLKAITSIELRWNCIPSITSSLGYSSLKNLCMRHNQVPASSAMHMLT